MFSAQQICCAVFCVREDEYITKHSTFCHRPNHLHRMKCPYSFEGGICLDNEFKPQVCDDMCGRLPSCGSLAVSYVPFQQENSKRYNQIDALANGTLFPGLNLPFHLKMEPSSLAESAVLELQALHFVLVELGLYLDTHKGDTEAFRLFQQYSKLAEEGKRRYEAAFGPLTQMSAAKFENYTWLNSPWPWEYRKEGMP